MQVILAEPRGFCAGVERAIEIVEKALERFGPPIYVRHQIVHNRHVVERLEGKGVRFVNELDEVPRGGITIFSAHGVARKVEEEAALRGLDVIDATCPLVLRVHHDGAHYVRNKYDVVLIGHAGHPEVVGTLGRLDGQTHLVSTIQDVERLEVNNPERVAYITQTTLSVDDTREIIDALKSRYPKIVGPELSEICYASQNRQRAVTQLASGVDCILVIGSKNSSNSNRLRELSQQHGVPGYLIDDAGSLRAEWFIQSHRVGITAGASAPEDLVQGVIAELKGRYGVELQTLPGGTKEDIRFKLPVRLEQINNSVMRETKTAGESK